MEPKGTFIGNSNTEKPRTGFGDCDIKKGRIVALLFTGRNVTHPLDVNLFIDGLSGQVYLNDSAAMIPIKNIAQITLTGGDVATADVGDFGGSYAIAENQTVFGFLIDAGSCFAKELYKLEKRQMRVWFVYDNGHVEGTVSTNAAGKDVMSGYLVSDVYPYEAPANGTTPAAVNLQITMSMNYRDEKKNAIGFYVGLAAIPDGLLGVRLVDNNDGTATVRTLCGNEDVSANNPSAWASPTLYVSEGGIAPTTVTMNADGHLSFTPEDNYRVREASVLRDAGIYGLDGAEVYTLTGTSA